MSSVIAPPGRQDFGSSRATTSSPVSIPIDDRVMRHSAEIYWKWRAAFDRDLNASPLQHPDVVIAELATAGRQSHLKPTLICDESRTDLPAIAVLVPKSVRSSQVGGVGFDRVLQGLRLAGGRILGGDESFDQQRQLLNSAAEYATNSDADFLLIEDLDESNPLNRAVHEVDSHECLLFRTHDYQPRHYIDLPDSEEQYEKSVSGHSRRMLRQKLKKCPDARLERITEITQIADFLEAAHEISTRTWQSNQFGIRIRNDEAELRQMTALATNQLLRSYVLWIEGKPAAFGHGVQHGTRYCFEETGYKSELRHLSPGWIMLQQIIVDLVRHSPARSFDFGFGDAEYKRQVANRSSRSACYWLVPPTLRARLSLSHLNICRQLRSAVYTRIKQSGFSQTVRRWIRSSGSSTESNTKAQPKETVAEHVD